MNGREVEEALARVRDMQTLVLDHQRFAGFSGGARLVGGAAVLLAVAALRFAVPAQARWQLVGWAALLAVGLAVNFSALAYWLWRRRASLGAAEGWSVAELFPALIVGAAFTAALVRVGALDLLFGAWMSLYGLAHASYRRSLPFAVYCGGLAYVAAGVFCLLWPGIHFADPRPMGLVFGAGELFGGWALLRSRRRDAASEMNEG
jgi:hypothetical protein